jgi:Protein of unknown function (DUF 659)
MSDGWTDENGTYITIFLVISPMGTNFLKSIDSSSYFKDASKLFFLTDGVIDKISEENVVQVVADSSSAYVSVGKLLMKKEQNYFKIHVRHIS